MLLYLHFLRSPSPRPEASAATEEKAEEADVAKPSTGGSEGSDQQLVSPAPSSAGGQIPGGGRSMRRLSQTSKKSAARAAGASDATHDAMGSKWSKGLWDNMESKFSPNVAKTSTSLYPGVRIIY